MVPAIGRQTFVARSNQSQPPGESRKLPIAGSRPRNPLFFMIRGKACRKGQPATRSSREESPKRCPRRMCGEAPGVRRREQEPFLHSTRLSPGARLEPWRSWRSLWSAAARRRLPGPRRMALRPVSGALEPCVQDEIRDTSRPPKRRPVAALPGASPPLRRGHLSRPSSSEKKVPVCPAPQPRALTRTEPGGRIFRQNQESSRDRVTVGRICRRAVRAGRRTRA